MAEHDEEEQLLRSVALQNAQSILLARQRAERELIEAREALTRKSEELAQSLAMMRATLESTTDGIMVVDHAGNVTDFNEQFVKMWRLPREIVESRDRQRFLEIAAPQLTQPEAFVARTTHFYAVAPDETFDVLEFLDGRVFERYSKVQRVGEASVGRVWSYRDVTERRAAEEEARRQREWFEVTLSSIGDAVITTDTEARVTFLNPVAEMLVGWSLNDAIGRSLDEVFRIIHEDTRAPARSPVTEVLARGVTVGLANHTALISKDGRETAIEDSAAPIKDSSGKIIGAVMVFHDVTERRRAQKALQQSEKVLSDFFENAAVGLQLVGPDGRILRVNRTELELLGYREEEYVGRHISDFHVDASVIETVLSKLSCGETLESCEARLRCKDGSIRHVLISSNVLWEGGKFVHTRCFTRDITEQKLAQEALRASHDQFSAILNQSPVGVYLLDSELRIRHVNPKARPVFAGLGEVVGRAFREILEALWPAEIAAELLAHFQHTLATGEPFYSAALSEMRQRRRTEAYYDWELHRILLPDREYGVVCYFIDISAHVLAEQALRRSEAELRALADSIPQLAWMANPDGYIFWYNRGWYDYTGKTHEEMQGWGWQSVHRPDTLPLVIERWNESLRTGDPFEMEFPLRGADGVFRWFLTRVNPVRGSEGAVIRWFGTNTDVDEVRGAQEALREETRILDLLNSTGQAIASKLDLQTLVQTVTDAGTELSGAQFGAFFYNVVDDQGESFLLYALSGVPREAFEKFGLPRATSVFRSTFRGEGVVRSADITKDARYGTMPPNHGMPEGHLSVRSYLAAPVVSRSGEVIGGLFFGHPEPGVFTERSERLIVGVAAQAAVGIDNARLYEAAQREIAERKRAEEEVAAARDAAETANLSKDDFIAALSHELRTPLTPVLAILSDLRDDPTVTGQVAEDLETVRRNVELEARLIDDLLDLTRVTRGKLELKRERRRIGGLIEDALKTCSPELESKHLTLVCELEDA